MTPLDIYDLEDAAKSVQGQLTLEQATALSEILLQAADLPTAVPVETLVSLMQPASPHRPRTGSDLEVQRRRQRMRETADQHFQAHAKATSWTLTIHHHPDDYRSAVSAVQYRAEQAGLTFSRERQDERTTVFTLRRIVTDL